MTQHPPTPDDLLRAVTDALHPQDTPPGEDDSLIAWGLDSITLMRIAGGWRKRGVKVSFAELAKEPTLRAWRALLDAHVPTPPAPAPAPVSVVPDEPFPLAVMQHAYWIGRGDDTNLGSVAAHLYVEFDGTGVEPDRLDTAVRALAARHAMLRARFTDDGRQQILPELTRPATTVNDLRELDEETAAAKLEELRQSSSHARLDVAAGEVFSVQLSLLPGGITRLHVDVDMLAADALSYRVLLSDLAALYREPGTALPAIRTSYPEYLAERAEVRRLSKEQSREWWARRVPELPSAPELPLVPEAERADPTRVTRRHHWLPPAEKQRLTARAHRHGLTPAMAVATAFSEVLAAWSGQPRFLLNVPMFDRRGSHPDVDLLVGDFTSSVLLDVDLTGQVSFTEHARRLQDRMHTDAAHADHSGVEVLRDLSRHNGEQVLAPVVFTSALNLGELFDAGVTGSFGKPVWIISQGPQVLLDAQVTEVDGGLLVNWDVREDAFPAGLIDAMFAAFHGLVTRLGTDDGIWEQPVPALLPPEQSAVRAAVNATAAPRSHRLLHQAFFERAAEHPDAPALLWGAEGALSYGELADRALRTAAALRERGTRPGDTVAVSLPKGPDQLTAALGVLAAGAAYVPIGIEQPAARRERIQATAGFRLALTDGRPLDGVDTLSVAEAIRTAPLAEPTAVDEEQPAYVLFTSGSTGEPKGVEVPHRAAVNTIDDLNDRYHVGPSDRCLAVSALDFDLSVYDVFGLLGAGGAVVLVDEADRREASRWADLVRRHRVTLLNCAPPLLDMLLLATGPGELAGLRTVLLGGDWVGTDLPGRLAERAPGCRFTGLGGTTETAIHSTVCEVTDARVPAHWRAVPYGTPLRNVRCRVVDARGRDCPDWVPGELWIGGDGVALGYRKDPERTAEKFVELDGVRWYRTGDLARYWPDGTLEFLGRRDHQVKLRGFRIELGEVEAALAGHPAVRRAVAGLTRGHGVQLAAAVAAEGVAEEELREWARTVLPPHMVPYRITVTRELPLTSNGKLDRRAVQQLWAAEGELEEHRTPGSALETVVARTWGEVLGVERVGLDDGFFALGGDSVLATVIVSRLREALDTSEVTVRALFATLTAGGMAKRLSAEEETPGRLEQVAAIRLEIEEMSEEEVDSALRSV
ncbi:amino acid adenylation domain-containing protein [Streptomyces cylindrosporus]|uniref:Phenyloxazoline synthase MbtB n=1 Tax=Streptomyces cylindrosporus TaxID=2927583 RepID=A0ABS9YEK1_9ACTN|nr:amino acid adenylation domain-containing protein [Streptomyces cylindrosporus]MCI3275399.1 amino acid adenylation domain-containing protein [Streptomyces cylindrosporus]